jgi:hypothetical protein
MSWYLWQGDIFRSPLSSLYRRKEHGECKDDNSPVVKEIEPSTNEQESSQQGKIPSSLDYLLILETDSAYIVPQGKTESVQTYRGRIYDTMEILMNTEAKPPSMRIQTLWPNIEWPRIWKNLCTAPVTESTKQHGTRLYTILSLQWDAFTKSE